MAEQPQKVIVQSQVIDATLLPAIFSLPYRLYVIQQNSDIASIADASNSANDLAYQATLENEAQNIELADHESRIAANTSAISLLDIRLTTVEGGIITISSNVDYLLSEVIFIEGDMVSKSSTSNQNVQSGGGSLLIGNVTSPTTDALQVEGSENVSVSYKVAGIQVVAARQTGWTAATGTALLGSFNANQTYSASATYTQTDIISIRDGLIQARQRIKALEDMARNHGLIN